MIALGYAERLRNGPYRFFFYAGDGQAIVEENQQLLLDRWNEYFNG